MANIPISDFPAASSANASDVLAGVQDDVTKKFSFAIVLNWIKQQITSLFVPISREINGKDLSTDITLDASDVGAVDTADVGVADGVASLDSTGKVPGTQLDLSGKQDKITANGILKGDGQGGVTAATPGTDYGTYSKPSGGIPSSDMASAVQTSLGKADTAYQKPSGGIPASDLASGVIPAVPSASDAVPQDLGTAAAGSSANYSRADHVHKKPTAGDVGAIPTSARGAANGVASLSSTGKVPTSQLPTIPSAATATPVMDSPSGYVGASARFAREDHEHPENYKKLNQAQAGPMEPTNASSQAYEVGQYFNKITAIAVGTEITYYCDFCRVTAPIASGGTLTENTNYVVTTIADELPYLQNTVLQSSGVTVTFTRKTADITASNLVSVFSRGNASENYHLIGMWVSNKFITFSVAGGLSVTSSSTGSLQISVPAAASNIAMTSVGARLASITV